VFYSNLYSAEQCHLTDRPTELLFVTAKQDAARFAGHVAHVERKLSPGASW
jgi:hypothetical protein